MPTLAKPRPIGENDRRFALGSCMILDEPQLFIHDIDFDRRMAVFVKIGRSLIDERNAHNFDDLEPKYAFELDTLLAEDVRSDHEPGHFLFMTDFCGSTLLANALAKMPQVTCLQELRVFAGLALRKRLLDRGMCSSAKGAVALDEWRRVLRLVIGVVFRSARCGEVVLAKEWPPTNYIMSEILRSHEKAKGVFLYSGLEDYLNAIFRQPWRRDFTRRRVLTELVEIDRWPEIDAAKYSLSDGQIAATHWRIQQEAFLQVDHDVIHDIRSLHSADFFDNPVDAIVAVARHFGMKGGRQDATDAYAAVSDRHSKNMERRYSMFERRSEIATTTAAYRREITEAMAFADARLGADSMPRRLPASIELERGLTQAP
jgi:hypothetical protein